MTEVKGCTWDGDGWYDGHDRCRERHCTTCRGTTAHHPDGNGYVCPGCRADFRGWLTKIGETLPTLATQARDKGVNSTAAMLTGPGWKTLDHVEAWGHRRASIAVGRVAGDWEDPDPRHPHNVLGWIVVALDEDYELDLDPHRSLDVSFSIALLGRLLDRIAADPEQDQADLWQRVYKCWRHVTAVARTDDQHDRTRVPCLDCGVRLEQRYATTAKDDRHVCPRCGRTYDDGEYARAKHQWLACEQSDRLVLVSDAAQAVERTENTVRSWMRRGDIGTACDLTTKRLMVWWPDVRDTNRAAKTREMLRTIRPTG